MQIIYLDISNKGVIPTIYAKQNDVGRKFAVILTDSGLPYIPEIGSVFSVWYKGTSGEGNYTDIGDKPAFSLSGNKVEVEMIVQMLSAHGDGILCLTLNSPDGNQISSWNIPYMCEIVPGSESEKAEEYYTAFSKAVEEFSHPDETLSIEGKAADAAAVGEALAKKADTSYTKKIGNPHNLLDNSDFRDPVNQRGQSSYVGAVYGIDRWEGDKESCSVNVANGYIEIVQNPASAATTKLWIQKIPVSENIRGKTVTLAAKIKGGSVRLNFNNTSMSPYVDSDDWSICVRKAVIPEDADTFFVGLQSRNTTDFQCEWAALYEGEYTVETLPEYQPKGHATELLECQRYYVSFGNMTFRSSISEDTIHNITIMFPVPMRIIPTISATAVEGEVPKTVSVTRHGIAYSVYGAKYTLWYVSASADL